MRASARTAVLIVCLLLAAQSSHAVTAPYYWIGGDGIWANPNAWSRTMFGPSCGQVPPASTDSIFTVVTIAGGVQRPVTCRLEDYSTPALSSVEIEGDIEGLGRLYLMGDPADTLLTRSMTVGAYGQVWQTTGTVKLTLDNVNSFALDITGRYDLAGGYVEFGGGKLYLRPGGVFNQTGGTTNPAWVDIRGTYTLGYGSLLADYIEIYGQFSVGGGNVWADEIVTHGWLQPVSISFSGGAVTTKVLDVGPGDDCSITLNMTGGVVTCTGDATRSLRLAGWNSSQTTFNMGGGELRLQQDAQIGSGSNSTVSINHTSGLVDASGYTITIDGTGQTDVTYAHSGGTIRAGEILLKGGAKYESLGGYLDASVFNQDGGRINGQFVSRGTFNYKGGHFSGQLINLGAANLSADFTAPMGITSTGVINVSAGEALTVMGAGFICDGQLNLAGNLNTPSLSLGVWGSAAVVQSTPLAYAGSMTLPVTSGNTASYEMLYGLLTVESLTVNANGLLDAASGWVVANASITQNGGQISGTVENVGTFTYAGGVFDGKLFNRGVVVFQDDFAAGQGLDNRHGNLQIPSIRTVVLSGDGLINSGTMHVHGNLLGSQYTIGEAAPGRLSQYESANYSTVTFTYGYVGNGNSGTVEHLGGSASFGAMFPFPPRGGLVIGNHATGQYDLSGGSVWALSETIGANAPGSFTQYGGDHSVMYTLTVGAAAGGLFEMEGGSFAARTVVVGAYAGGAGFLSIGGEADFQASYLYLGGDDPTPGECTFSIGEGQPRVTVDTGLFIGPTARIEAVSGSVIHMQSGSVFNTSTSPSLLDPLVGETRRGTSNIKLVFDGRSTAASTIEVATRTLTKLPPDFILGGLQIGGDQPAHLKLVDAFDNHPASPGSEMLYVNQLTITDGSLLDMGGLGLAFRLGGVYKSLRPGDANIDSYVNDDDLSLLLANWGSSTAGWTRGNFNAAGNVNDDDLSLLLANWTGGGSTVPEPATCLMLLAAAAGILRRRR